MAEEQQSREIGFSEVMLAMDVVDTLRHERSLVERELQSEDREGELIAKLRKIYADQGLEVSDEIIAQGVRAMREERFTYQPPKAGLKTTLARIYVNRGRWARRIAILFFALAALWVGYRYLVVMPAERGRVRLASELNNQAAEQQEQAKALQGRITAANSELESALQSIPQSVVAPANRLAGEARQALASASRQLDALEKLPPIKDIDTDNAEGRSEAARKRLNERKKFLDGAQNDLAGAQAAVESIREWKGGFQDLDSLRADALKEARERGIPEKIEALYNNAISALKAGDLETARTARQALVFTRDMLRQEYTLQIVSRPGTPSGVWRYPAGSQTARNYYLIVEAITPSGQRLNLPITSEEDGKVRVASAWGLRVDQRVYEQVRQDKMDDGIVNRKMVGAKKRGYLTPEYRVSTTGATITEW
jgi:TolA-binding protein